MAPVAWAHSLVNRVGVSSHVQLHLGWACAHRHPEHDHVASLGLPLVLFVRTASTALYVRACARHHSGTDPQLYRSRAQRGAIQAFPDTSYVPARLPCTVLRLAIQCASHALALATCSCRLPQTGRARSTRCLSRERAMPTQSERTPPPNARHAQAPPLPKAAEGRSIHQALTLPSSTTRSVAPRALG